MNISDDTKITPEHVYRLVMDGYVKPLQEKYSDKKITVVPRHDGSLYQRSIAALALHY